jgi:hypothetical protein
MTPKMSAGQFVKFTYRPPPPAPKRIYTRKAVPQKQADGSVIQVPVMVQTKVAPPPPSDANKEVFILHPNWNGKMHAIDLGRVTPAEIQVLHAIMDPNVKSQVDAGVWPVEGVPNYPLVRDILRRMDPVQLINNPLAFYQMMVKPFIRNKDCYRQYWPQFVLGLQVIAETHVNGPMINPKPLFKK